MTAKKTDEYNVISPVPYFNKYLELIFANDDLWENFQYYVRQTLPDRGDRFFERHRDPECIEIWRQMLENMGGGIPLSLFASAAFLLLAYKDQGHDLDVELAALKEPKLGYVEPADYLPPEVRKMFELN